MEGAAAESPIKAKVRKVVICIVRYWMIALGMKKAESIDEVNSQDPKE